MTTSENLCSSPTETYTRVHTDSDRDYIVLENSGLTNYISIPSNSGHVKVEAGEIPALLRNIAAAAGVEVLVLPKPKKPALLSLLSVTPAPAEPGNIQIDRGFDFAFRLTPTGAADLIWRIAEALAQSSQMPARHVVSQFTADLRHAGLIVNSSTSAEKLLAVGYRKDPAHAVKKGSLIHVFNELPGVAGGDKR